MQDCIFCKITKGEIPSYKIYEDDMFIAFLDIAPATLGHTLVVPKVHCVDVFDLPEEYASKLLPLASKLANQIKESLGCEGLNVLQNNGSIAGQTVFHYHMHLIPRYKNDNMKVGWEHLSPTKEEFADIVLRLDTGATTS